MPIDKIRLLVDSKYMTPAQTKGRDIGFRAASKCMRPSEAEIAQCAAAYTADPTAQADFVAGFTAGYAEYGRVSRESAHALRNVRWR